MASCEGWPEVINGLRSTDVVRNPTSVGAVIVFSGSELIGDGVVGLLPREWRDRIAVVSELDILAQRLLGQRAAVIVDADTEEAADALRLANASGGSAILLLGSVERRLEHDLIELADAIIRRDEVEALTLRTALAAGRLGMRLVPRSLPLAGLSAPSINESALSEPGRRALALLAEGKRDAEIARQLSLSESAVRKLVQRTVRSVGARTRCQAVAIVARDGELAPTAPPPTAAPPTVAPPTVAPPTAAPPTAALPAADL
jgi:DNA-binding CsgD family transcriptional regulator